MRAILLLFSGILAANAADLCSVEGTALDATTGAPLRDVKLRLRPAGAAAGRGSIAFVTLTDETGKFAFAAIEPGAYAFTAERAGFTTEAYGARRPGAPGTPLTLEPGQKKTSVEFRLRPQGVIAGRALEAGGEPAGDIFIYAARARYVNGRKQLALTSRTGSLNDLGEYRIFGLEPGHYYIVAVPIRFASGAAGPKDISGRPPETYQTTYYPDTPDPRAAEALDVAPGAILSGVDLQVIRLTAFFVRGRVLNQTGGELTEMWVAMNPAAGPGITSFSDAGSQGRVVFDNLPQGTQPVAVGGTNSRGRVVSTRHMLGVRANVDDLQLAIKPPFPVQGRLTVEGAAIPKNLKVKLAMQEPLMGDRSAREADVAADGAFTLPDGSPDRYFASVTGMPDGFYIKSIRLAKQNVLENGADLPEKPEQPLEIALSPKAGSIRGTVTGAQAGVVVALVPSKGREYRNTTTDEHGRFTIANLPPGEYKLFAWEEVEDGAWMDPAFLKPIESKGTPVTVREATAETVELKPL